MLIIRYALLAITVTLAGCAATPPTVSADDNIDVAYVNAVNRVAQARGLQVVWMRYPTKGESRQ